MDPEALRADIPALADCAYFNTGASGPSPQRVLDAITDVHRRHKADAVCEDGMYEVASATREAARETVADHLGADPGEIALTDSTVEGVNVVANALDWEAGDVVVRPDFEHPAGILPWQYLADRVGVEERVVETTDGRLELDVLATAVDGDTRLVCCSSLTWSHGTRVPVADVVEVAHESGAKVLVDAVQSVGQHPVDVGEWGADFVAASGHKWVLGPWGSGVLYVCSDVVEELSPGRVGYFGVDVERESERDPGADAALEHPFAADASRFELGTAALGPWAGLAAGIETIESVGIPTIQTRVERLTDRLKDGLGGRLLSPDGYESGLVTFTADEPVETVDRLADEGLRIRAVPDPLACRASIHAFNTAGEVDRLLAAL
jgi:selenocysteine lyase/cysteine desulfurase